MPCDVLFQRGAEAASLLQDDGFRNQWLALHQLCPWSTVFQSPGYLQTWYKVYEPLFEPVLLACYGEAGKLVGFLASALDRTSGSLVLAGKPHAEYHGWLAAPENSDAFIEASLDRLQREFPGGHLDFSHLAPGTPVGWLSAGDKWSRLCELTTTPRPLMAVEDGSAIQKSLRSRSNKKHLKYYERMEGLEFLHTREFHEIESSFSDLIDFCDFRQCALYGKTPFRGDPYKKPFFIALFGIPELLYATAWRSNEGLISAHIGFRNRDQVVLGILVHSPTLSEHSPGTLHLLFLGRLLAEERIAALDLTPGGSYKDRFATHQDQVDRLTVHFSEARLKAKRISDRAVGFLKAGLGAASISPQRAREALDRGRCLVRVLGGVRRPRRAMAALTSRLTRSSELLSFRLGRHATTIPNQGLFSVGRDCVSDLLAYRPIDPWDLPLSDFLRRALNRFDQGDHVYTCSKDGVLIASIWLREPRETADQPVDSAHLKFPDGALLLEELRVHCEVRDANPPDLLLARILKDSTSTKSERPIYAVVSRSDAVARAAVERSGFEAV